MSDDEAAEATTPDAVKRAILELEPDLLDLREAASALHDLARTARDAGDETISGHTLGHFADAFRTIHDRLRTGFERAHDQSRAQG